MAVPLSTGLGTRLVACSLAPMKRSNNIMTHTHTFNGPLSGTTWVSRYQKDKTNLDFTEARDSEWQWHQLGHMQVCALLQTDNHASIPPLSFLQAGCPSCCPANSVKALKAAKLCEAKHCKQTIAVCNQPRRYKNSRAMWECYLPPGRGDISALTLTEASTRFSDPGWMQG